VICSLDIWFAAGADCVTDGLALPSVDESAADDVTLKMHSRPQHRLGTRRNFLVIYLAPKIRQKSFVANRTKEHKKLIGA
jgi:hypothetical protein